MIGDHGMSDAGSHGGASVSEVMTPIVALSPVFAEKGNHTANTAGKRLQLVNQQVLFLEALKYCHYDQLFTDSLLGSRAHSRVPDGNFDSGK